MTNPEPTSAPAGGFGRMLNSLHGLQQRLDDFTVTDVANAEANAQTLILRLRLFQGRIDAVAHLQNLVTEVSQSIASLPRLDTIEVGLDSLESHPQLHAIVQASKLIKLHKLMVALKSGASAGDSLEPKSDEALQPLVSRLAAANFEAVTPPLSNVRSGTHDLASETVTTPSMAETATMTDRSLDHADADLASSRGNSLIGIPEPSDRPIAEDDFAMPAATTTVENPASLDADLAEELAAAATPQSTASMASMRESVGPAPAKSGPQESGENHTPEATTKTSAAPDNRKALVPANENFDMRLLDDLVSNYGDFAANPNLPATVKKNELQTLEPAAAKAAPSDQLQEPTPVKKSKPAAKKAVDLDRQLKKIIKDYGENDLYSDKKSTDFKKIGIIAMAALALIVGVLYFSMTRPPAVKANVKVSDTVSGTAALDGTQSAEPSLATPTTGALKRKEVNRK